MEGEFDPKADAWWSEMIKRGFVHNTSAEYQAWLDRRAHANAALEEAAVEADGRTLSSENCRTDGGCSHVQCLIAREIAAAIRALREEE